MNSIIKNKKGLSPVIATVILIAVTIVVAVSVAYWMGSIASSYTSFEQIEMPTAYAEYGGTLFWNSSAGWKINIDLKNTGSNDATINYIHLNSKPVTAYNGDVVVADSGNINITGANIPVAKGSVVSLKIYIAKGSQGVDNGVRVDFKFHSASGQDYPLLIRLP